MKPTIGRIVIYRSRTGDYDVPAIVTATQASLKPEGVEAGRVPALSAADHVHLTVFTPGCPGLREGAALHGRSENVAGCYQEWDIPMDLPAGENPDPRATKIPAPGTWRWPERV